MFHTFGNLNDLNGAIHRALYDRLVSVPQAPALAQLIADVRTAARIEGYPFSVQPFSPESILAAVNTVALAQELPLRDGIAEAARIAAGLV
jgi:hypothetical protein